MLGGLVTTGAQVTAASPELSNEIKEALRQRGIDIDSVQQEARNPQTKERAEQTARETGERVAGGLSMAGILGFVTLILGLGAAAFGGRTGMRYPPLVETRPIERAA
jgi:hypothetical protein